MNRFILFGGFAGFIVVFATGLAYQRDLNDLLLDAMIGCFVIAFLSRLLYRKLEYFAVNVLKKRASWRSLRLKKIKIKKSKYLKPNCFYLFTANYSDWIL